MIALRQRGILSLERKYAKAIRNALVRQVKHASKNDGEVREDFIENVLNDLYYDVMIKAYQGNVNIWANMTGNNPFNKAKINDFFTNITREFVTRYIRDNIGVKVKEISDTSRKRIQRAIEIGTDDITSRGGIANIIMDLTPEIASYSRARMIARTETSNAANASFDKSAEDWKENTGDKMLKTWIHRGAEKHPRSWHQYLDNGEYIDEKALFTIIDNEGNIEYGLRPHDPMLSAKNVINCSCEVFYIPDYIVNNI